ncbi:cyclic nucleotide-binding domain-containing protein [Methylobacter tundripaludum]|uniref:Putative transcriptional regulator, Crp/Fnr family n=1 Tax=Methylobacter tundripaludum (strain ATCC BAA-1195 / DSM 17260 / SV96) TaxID=697282 RepID=G3IUY4_METTV|nr:cyclic nucleotide-binding domain-containing protein [Methylobacter tundripaludum]EGW22780.1 putative transcriptional regulator, Crp/Fnr family [Methylobacter tundripaludum SV96]
MTVDVNSEDGLIIRKLIPLATLPGARFNALCAEMTVEEIQDGFLFKKGDVSPQLVYLISGEVTLQAVGLVVEVIAAGSDSAKFALAHQIPRKIDAVANGRVRFLRLNADIVNNPLSLAYKEDNSYMVIDETEGDPDDWMTALLRSPIFQRLPPANLQKILMSLEVVHFKSGETILEQGGIGDYYYLIKNGQCLLTRKPSPNAKEIKLAQLANGDTFGEDSLLSGAPRNVTITALTDIVLLRLDKKQFISLIKEPSLKFVDYEGMQEAIKQGAVLLDVRSQDDYEHQHLDGSISAPFFSLRMQLKAISHERPVVVVCQDGKVSEAAAFLLLRHKIDAMILSGGMESLAAYAPSPEIKPNITTESENEALLSGEGHVESDGRKQSANILEDQVSALKLENEALKSVNQQLNDKCIKLEFDKQHAEKQCRILHKQMEKLTQVLDKLKGG